MVGYADLANVMHQRSIADLFYLGFGQPNIAPQNANIMAQPEHVHAGLVIAIFARPAKPLQDLQTGVLQFEGSAFKHRRALLHQFFEQAAAVIEREVRRDTRQHNGGTDRFDDVINAAQSEAFRFVVGVGACGDEDHRNVAGAPFGLEQTANLIAIHVRHQDIEQDQVGWVA